MKVDDIEKIKNNELTFTLGKIWNRCVVELKHENSKLRRELYAHLCTSLDQNGYWALRYQIDWIVDPIIDPLFKGTEPLIRFTVQTFLAHPLVVYSNNAITDSQPQQTLSKILITGLKYAYIGPALVCWAKYELPSMFEGLMQSLIINMLRGVIACAFFKNIGIVEFCSILPLVLLSGLITGSVYFYASSLFESLGLDPKDTFYLSIMLSKLLGLQLDKFKN